MMNRHRLNQRFLAFLQQQQSGLANNLFHQANAANPAAVDDAVKRVACPVRVHVVC